MINIASSLPVRGAWIEISQGFMNFPMLRSLPVRGAWIEIKNAAQTGKALMESLPVRGAWIEMYLWQEMTAGSSTVAPRAGSVD